MKTIIHPSPSFIKYSQLLQFIQLPIYLCYAIQNIWITAIMISYDTPNLIDAFVWILPNILTIFTRPACVRYIHTVAIPRQAELSLISYLLFLGSCGCCLVAVSAQYFVQYRIGVCVLGWTLVDTCFDLALYLGGKTRERLQKLGYQQISYASYGSFLGSLLGYGASFALCLWKGGKTVKKFLLTASYIYWLGGIITGLYWLTLYMISFDKFTLQSQPFKKSIACSKHAAEYLPGLYETRRSKGSDRWYFALHFCHLYIVDTLLIYGGMWIAWVYQFQGHRNGPALNLAMQQASLLLVMFCLLSQLNLFSRLTSKMDFNKIVNIFKMLLIFICICACLLYHKPHHTHIYLFTLLVALAQNYYTSQILPQLSKNNLVFSECSQLVQRVQKLFILCPMPFFIMIVLNRNDIQDCLMGIVAVVGGLIAIGFVWKDWEIKASEVQKVKIKIK